MNIRWDAVEHVFIAEFDEFQGDLEAAKAAGFRPLGVPPPWIWHAPSPGIKALNRLREKRPASGLTISPEALEVYKPLAEAEAKNDAVKKQLTEVKKKLKKTLKESAKCDWLPIGKEYLDVEDLPPRPSLVSVYTPPTPPDLKCLECSQPVYFYEQQNPPLCLWCEKELENDLF